MELVYTYGKLFAGAAVEAGDEALAAIEALPGVAAVSRTQVRSLPQTAVSDPLTDTNSLPLMGAADLAGLGYDGEGTVVAVIDSGLRYTHEAFADHGLSEAPAITAEDTAAFLAAGGTQGRYISSRIPFAYDYYGGDDDVWTEDSHGTHIAALAAGYARDEDGAVRFRGAAPAAQILAMKVFPDNSGSGADDSDILRAMEDAWTLGADVINLSLGSDSGFTADGALGGAYAAAFQALREAGVILCCAAGNAGYATYGKLQGTALPTAAYTDYGTLASPASYRGTVAVAAAGPTVYHAAGYLSAGDRQISFSQGTDAGGAETPQLLALAGETLDFVPVGGVGAASDYAGLDLTGRIALVARGELSFTEKVQNAAAAGAAACLIYNNEEGTITPSVEDAPIPCAAVTAEDGAYLLSLVNDEGYGALTVSGGAYLATASEDPTLLTPSAWGPTSDLRLVPTLTAPGGRVLSASAAGDSAYEELDGTSMAAGNAAGVFALMVQALRQRGIEDRREIADLAEALLESTARIVTDESGAPLSPRRQGAGLIDAGAALASPAVVLEPLLEVGDNELGRFTLTLEVKNLSETDLTFTPSVTVLTDDYGVSGETYYTLLSPLDITEEVTVSGSRTLTVPAGEDGLPPPDPPPGPGGPGAAGGGVPQRVLYGGLRHSGGGGRDRPPQHLPGLLRGLVGGPHPGAHGPPGRAGDHRRPGGLGGRGHRGEPAGERVHLPGRAAGGPGGGAALSGGLRLPDRRRAPPGPEPLGRDPPRRPVQRHLRPGQRRPLRPRPPLHPGPLHPAERPAARRRYL